MIFFFFSFHCFNVGGTRWGAIYNFLLNAAFASARVLERPTTATDSTFTSWHNFTAHRAPLSPRGVFICRDILQQLHILRFSYLPCLSRYNLSLPDDAYALVIFVFFFPSSYFSGYSPQQHPKCPVIFRRLWRPWGGTIVRVSCVQVPGQRVYFSKENPQYILCFYT